MIYTKGASTMLPFFIPIIPAQPDGIIKQGAFKISAAIALLIRHCF
jgi:hypothetical protein